LDWNGDMQLIYFTEFLLNCEPVETVKIQFRLAVIFPGKLVETARNFIGKFVEYISDKIGKKAVFERTT
jgi:hypothetical protein